MIKFSNLKAKAFDFLLRYKMRLVFATGALVWIVAIRAIVAITPLTPLIRLGLQGSFLVLYVGFTAAFSQLIANPISFSVETWWYNRKHQPEATEFPEVLAVAKEMGLHQIKKVMLTDNPRVKSAYVSMITRTITLPRSWKDENTLERLVAIVAHELAHLKTRVESYLAMAIVLLGTTAGVFVIANFEPTTFAQAGGLVVFYFFLSWALRRNEYRADEVAADQVGMEPLIAVFQDFIAKGYTEGSETHPSPQKRINALRRHFAKKRKK